MSNDSAPRFSRIFEHETEEGAASKRYPSRGDIIVVGLVRNREEHHRGADQGWPQDEKVAENPLVHSSPHIYTRPHDKQFRLSAERNPLPELF